MKLPRPLQVAALAIAAITLAASGCTIKAADPGSTESGVTTLTFWEYYQGTQEDWLKAQVATFEQNNPNVKIDLVKTVGAQHDQKLLASVATGTTPDLFINNIVVDFPTLVSGGVMLDLTPYWNGFADKSKFPEQAAWSQDGKIFNLMSYTNLLGMFYNKDILDEYKISPPTTLDEMTTAMNTIRAAGKYSGVAMSGAPTVEGAWLFAPQFLGEGVDYCNIGDNTEKVTAAFNRLAVWRSNDSLPRAAATWDQNAAWQQFMTGKYAFGLNGNWQLGNVKKASFGYGTVQYPAPAGGTSKVFPGGEGFAIGAKTQHADLAWKFLEQMVLSSQGGESLYTAAGSIPINADAAQSETIKSDANVAPFVAAAQDTANWPRNSNTAAMQKALGTAVSAVISGQSKPDAAAQTAITAITEARQKGGGGCA